MTGQLPKNSWVRKLRRAYYIRPLHGVSTMFKTQIPKAPSVGCGVNTRLLNSNQHPPWNVEECIKVIIKTSAFHVLKIVGSSLRCDEQFCLVLYFHSYKVPFHLVIV